MSERYARAWRHAWLGWAVLTLTVAAVMWSAPAVLVLLVTFGALVSLVTGLVRSGAAGDAPVSPRVDLADGVRWAVLAVAVVVTGQLQVGLAFLVLVAIALSSPQLIRLFLGTGSVPGRRSAAVDVAAVLHGLDMEHAREAVDRLDLAGLCWAWSRSGDLLVQVPEAQVRAAVVSLRELYLDEMERRDPAGFAAWLASDAESGHPPEDFLAGPPDEDRSGGLAA